MVNKIQHKWLAWLVMLGMIFSLVTPAAWVKADEGQATLNPEDTVTQSVYGSEPQSYDLDKAIEKLIGYYNTQGIQNNDWVVFGLNALGEDLKSRTYATETQSYAKI